MMSDQTLISVITVSYNTVSIMEQTILSVINQTYSNIEYIIIDGGSIDGTTDIIKKYADKISYWVSEPDKGIYDAMNKGITQSHGKYLNFMNAGDFFYEPTTIENVIKVISGEDYITGIAVYPTGYMWKPVRKAFTFMDVFQGGAVNHQASFIKRDLLENGYDSNLKILADEKLFFEKVLVDGHTYLPIDQKICIYDGSGMSGKPEVLDIIAKERDLFFKENIPERILWDYYRMVQQSFFKKKLLLLKRIIKKCIKV